MKNTYQVIKAWSRPKITRVEGFKWKKSVWKSRERSEKWIRFALSLYIKFQLDGSKYLSRSIETKSLQKWIYQGAVEDLSTKKNLDGLRICQESIGQIEGSENWLDRSRSCWDSIENKPRNIDGSRILQDLSRKGERMVR